MKTSYVTDLLSEQTITSFFLVHEKEVRTTREGRAYLRMEREDPERIGVVMGTGVVPMDLAELAPILADACNALTFSSRALSSATIPWRCSGVAMTRDGCCSIKPSRRNEATIRHSAASLS